MRRPAALFALLALTLVPLAYGGEPTGSPEPTAPTEVPATAMPLSPFTPLPTAGLDICEFEGCEEEDLRYTVFYFEPDPECMNYCASNGWTFLDYCDAGRMVYLCWCCAG